MFPLTKCSFKTTSEIQKQRFKIYSRHQKKLFIIKFSTLKKLVIEKCVKIDSIELIFKRAYATQKRSHILLE
jgi:hypothetical protein